MPHPYGIPFPRPSRASSRLGGQELRSSPLLPPFARSSARPARRTPSTPLLRRVRMDSLGATVTRSAAGLARLWRIIAITGRGTAASRIALRDAVRSAAGRAVAKGDARAARFRTLPGRLACMRELAGRPIRAPPLREVCARAPYSSVRPILIARVATADPWKQRVREAHPLALRNGNAGAQ